MVAVARTAAAITVSGDSSFAILVTGTSVGTLQFERSLDAGTTWTSSGAFSAGNSYTAQTTTANGAFHGNAFSATSIRVRATAWTSGSAAVQIPTGAGTGIVTVGNPIRLFDAATSLQASIGANGLKMELGSALTAAADSVAISNPTRVTIQASGAQAASGSSANQAVGTYREALVTLNCTAASGTTPTLTVKLQASDDGGTTRYDLPDAAFTQPTTTGTQAIAVATFGDTLRAARAIGGTTPSFTFAGKAAFKSDLLWPSPTSARSTPSTPGSPGPPTR